MLWANIPAMAAARALRALNSQGPADSRRVSELVRQATGDNKLADHVLAKLMDSELRAGLTPT